MKDRLWFFGGYQYLRDGDSQPGTDPETASNIEFDKVFWKINWQIAPHLHLLHSFSDDIWTFPQAPSISQPVETTVRAKGQQVAATFVVLTHAISDNTFWEARLSGLRAPQKSTPVSGDFTTPAHLDLATGVWSQNAPYLSRFQLIRDSVQGKLSHYAADFLHADHDFKFGIQFHRGEHWRWATYPGNAIYYDYANQPYLGYFSEPWTGGGEFRTLGTFAEDVVRVGERLTLNIGLRFDHSHAISPDLPARNARGDDTGETIDGLGTLYTWNVLSPRLGFNWMVESDGKSVLRVNYGRFYQGVLTGLLAEVHPGITPTTATVFDPATGGYTNVLSVFDPITNRRIDPDTRSPHTDQFSIGFDRELGESAAFGATYVHKRGGDFIGDRDTGGVYGTETETLPDGRTLTVFPLMNSPDDRLFLTTNREDFFLRYNGLLLTFEKRWSKRWQVLASYSLSKAYGLQGATSYGASAAQDSDGSEGDPNVFINATGNLLDDRTHMFRVQGSVAIPKVGVLLATNFQHLTGKPWGARTVVGLPQGVQQVFIEPQGSRRLSSQTLVDFRVSKVFRFAREGKLEILVDVLNLLNDTAEEGIVTDNFFSSNFAQPNFYIDPRRAMIGVRFGF